MKAILFDLDGTLLDIDIEAFLVRYFSALGEAVREMAPGDPHHATAMQGIYDATGAMMRSHPGSTNQCVFNDEYERATGIDITRHHELFDRFYGEVFPGLGDGIGPRDGASEVLATARRSGLKIAIATNPIFPLAAIEHRLSWAGIDPQQADFITSYENMYATKPRPEYYHQTCDALGASPGECMMVGDDRALDLPAADIGMRTFYVGDDADAPADYRGDLRDLDELLGRVCEPS